MSARDTAVKVGAVVAAGPERRRQEVNATILGGLVGAAALRGPQEEVSVLVGFRGFRLLVLALQHHSRTCSFFDRSSH